MRLPGKTAVITDSTKGIGLGIARAFVREGARVVINERNADDCTAVAKELGHSAVAISADFSKSEEVRRLAGQALQALEVLAKGMLARGKFLSAQCHERQVDWLDTDQIPLEKPVAFPVNLV